MTVAPLLDLLRWKVRIDDLHLVLTALWFVSKEPKGALARTAARYDIKRWQVTSAIDRVEGALEIKLLQRKARQSATLTVYGKAVLRQGPLIIRAIRQLDRDLGHLYEQSLRSADDTP